MVKFLIVVPTYNRNQMLNETLKSIFDQTWPHWQLLVSDNASPTPVVGTIPATYQEDPRFSLIRREDLLPAIEHGEVLLQRVLSYDFDYFMFLADDDLLLPFALEQVARYCAGYSIIQSSLYGYNANDKTLGFSDMLNDPTKETIEYDPAQYLGWFAESNGITIKGDPVKHHLRPPLGPTHISAFFVGRDLLRRTLERYGRISVQPFGDAGFFKYGTSSGPCLYINRPLAIVRFHSGSQGNAAGAAGLANRARLAQQHNMELKHSPLKAITFSNGARESCLALLEDMGVEYSSHVGAGFLLRHTRDILRDRPWDSATARDLLEVLPFLIRNFFSIIGFLIGYLVRHEKLNYDSVVMPEVQSIWDAVTICAQDQGLAYLKHCRETIRLRKRRA